MPKIVVEMIVPGDRGRVVIESPGGKPVTITGDLVVEVPGDYDSPRPITLEEIYRDRQIIDQMKCL